MDRRQELKLYWLASRWSAPLSTRVSGFFADRLWFTPWRVAPSPHAQARRDAWLCGVEWFTSASHGHTLRGYSAGTGPTVLLVHGWGDDAATLGAFVRPLVDAGFRVVAVDMPGHGASSGKRVDAYDWREAIRGVARECGPVHAVIAHSVGGQATLLALDDGLDVQGVVLLAPSVDLEHALDRFETLFAMPRGAISGLRRSIERKYGRDVWTNLRATRLVRHISTPGLVIHDAGDEQVDHQDAIDLVAAWRSARLQTTVGLSHTKIARDAAVVRSAVRFIAGLRDARLDAAGS